MKAIKYFCIALCGMMIASCGSKKKAAVEETTETAIVDGANVSLEKIVETVNANRQAEQYMTSKMNLTLSSGSKNVNVGGSLKMKKNDVIQLSLVAFGVVEAGRMELTQDYFMLVDRIGHQYVKAAYKDIDFLKNNNIDFYTFQSLFWDELFLLGDKGLSPENARYEKSVDSGVIKLVNKDSRHVTLTFLANAMTGLIKQSTFASKATGNNVLDWKYLGYTKLGKQEFPSKMQISVHAGPAPLNATIILSNVNSEDEWETRTQLNKRYEKVPIETVFSRFMSLTL